MAGAGAKKRVEESAKRLSSLRLALIAALVIHASLRVLVYHSLLPGFWSTAMLLLSVAVGWLCYAAIAAFATPVYSPSGELIDGGADLNMRGMCGNYHDVLYVTVFAQAMSGLSLWFWLSYLVVPAYGLFFLWGFLASYWQSQSSSLDGQGGPQSLAERKKLERTQDRAERRRQKANSKW